MNRILTYIALALASIANVAATDYGTLAVKAARFYLYEEWPSALAMYHLMLEQRPEQADTYCHAIVAASLDGNNTEAMRLLSQSIDSRVPLDSIYNGVQRLAFEQGDARLYEQFLDNTSNTYPWLKRNIDARLLEYFTWRRDGRGMIEYATRMLNGMPDNVTFLTALADGYFTTGDDLHALAAYTKIIVLEPRNYHALLVLGNYYDNLSQQDRFNDEAHSLARQYLSRADAIRHTPYVTARLSALNN